MYPGGAQFCLSMTFDIEMSVNFPYWTSQYEDFGAIAEHVKLYIHKVLDVARRYGVKFQFFLVGSALEDPDIDYLKRLVDEGHALDNHTYRHVNVKAKQVAELHPWYARRPWRAVEDSPLKCVRQEMRQTTQAIRERLGVETVGFRTPGAFRNGLEDVPQVQALLKEEGFQYSSAHYNYPVERQKRPPQEVLEAAIHTSLDLLQPYRYPNDLPELPMMGISDAHAFRNFDLDRWEYIHPLKVAVDNAHARGPVLSILAHPSYLSARDPHCDMVDTIVRYALEKPGGCWVATNRQLCQQTLPPLR